MTTRCPHCGASNPDDLPFCNSCGEPVDADLRLVMDVKKSAQAPRAEQARRRDDDDDDEIVRSRDDEEEKKFPVGIVILAAVVVVAVVLFFVLR